MGFFDFIFGSPSLQFKDKLIRKKELRIKMQKKLDECRKKLQEEQQKPNPDPLRIKRHELGIKGWEIQLSKLDK